ncbi:hypothetical protein PIB30_014385 [Stylosanthes scabra]|uniref:FRIGIDA-like protein n=1 Tax=Stylosanthes scabra TaxID=79078 RepID=A0ABU6T8P2_9FABA|nr:hypothetical protein [Stylosanthes scabra]
MSLGDVKHKACVDSDDDDNVPLSSRLAQNFSVATSISKNDSSLQKVVPKPQKRNVPDYYADLERYIHSTRKREVASVKRTGSQQSEQQVKKLKKSENASKHNLLPPLKEKVTSRPHSKEKEISIDRYYSGECQMKREAVKPKSNLVEKEFEEMLKKLEIMKKQFDNIQGKLSSYSSNVATKKREYEALQRDIEDQIKELESKKKQSAARMQEIELKERQIEERMKKLSSKEEQFEDQLEEVESIRKKYESKEKILAARMEDIELKERQIEERIKKLNSKEEQFEVQLEEVESIRKKYESKEKRLAARMEDIELMERQLEERMKKLDSKDKQFEDQFEEVESIRMKYEIKLNELLFKEKQDEAQWKDLEAKMMQHEASVKSSKEQKQEVANYKDNHSSTDGGNLTLFSSEPKDTDVLNILRSSSDPAKAMLVVMKDAIAIENTHIFLLEHLMEISPHIESHVREEAMELVLRMKANMRLSTDNSLVVFSFLMILSTYKLVSSFSEDEVLELFEIVAHHKPAVELFRMLHFAFADKISDFVENLIKNEQYIKAVRFICAYDLPEKNRAADLLREHVNKAKLFEEPMSKSSKISTAIHEIKSLKTVLQCIPENQECEEVVKEIQDRIAEAEKLKRMIAMASIKKYLQYLL